MQFSEKGVCLDFQEYGITKNTQNDLIRFTSEQQTGLTIKKTIYRAKTESFSRGKKFPYTAFLNTFCLPESENFLENESYYLVTNYQTPAVKKKNNRYIPKEELILREIKNKFPGSKIRFDAGNKQPYLIMGNGYKLSCGMLRANTGKDLEKKPVADTGQYPKIINITDDMVFTIETEPGIYLTVTKEEYNAVTESIKTMIERVLLKRSISLRRTEGDSDEV